MILQLISCVESSMSSHWYVGHLIRFYVIHTSLETDFWIPISTYLLKHAWFVQRGQSSLSDEDFCQDSNNKRWKIPISYRSIWFTLSFFFYEAEPGRVSSIHNEFDVETLSLQCTYNENGLYSEVRDIFCPVSQKFNGVNILYFVRHTYVKGIFLLNKPMLFCENLLRMQ